MQSKLACINKVKYLKHLNAYTFICLFIKNTLIKYSHFYFSFQASTHIKVAALYPHPLLKFIWYKILYTLHSSHLAVSVIGCGFIKFFPQLEAYLCVLECTLGPDHHFVTFLANDDGGFGHIANLSGSKANSCREQKGKQSELWK